MHSEIITTLTNGNYPYSSNPIFSHASIKLAQIEFNRCKSFFDKYGTKSNDFLKISKETDATLKQIYKLEKNHKPELEQLAKQLVLDFFEITNEDLSFDVSISPNLQASLDEFDNITDVDHDKLMPHIQKRIILNSITHGAALHIWKSLQFNAKKEINQINPKLFNLYNKLNANSSILLWLTPPIQSISIETKQLNVVVQGQNSNVISNDDQPPHIIAEGTMFTTLIHEIVKGVIDVICLYGIDDSLSENELKYVYQNTDKYLDEYWYYILGSGLYQVIVENYVNNSGDIGRLIQDISLTSYPILIDTLIKDIDSFKVT